MFVAGSNIEIILLNAQKLHSARYLVDAAGAGLPPTTYSLEPHHTHFLLVDEGTWRSDNLIEYRAQLESYLNRSTSDGGYGCACFVLLYAGDMTSLLHALASLAGDVPLLICERSGPAADLLAFAFNSHIKLR